MNKEMIKWRKGFKSYEERQKAREEERSINYTKQLEEMNKGSLGKVSFQDKDIAFTLASIEDITLLAGYEKLLFLRGQMGYYFERIFKEGYVECGSEEKKKEYRHRMSVAESLLHFISNKKMDNYDHLPAFTTNEDQVLSFSKEHLEPYRLLLRGFYELLL